MPNPLIQDRNVEFLLYELLDAEKLCELPVFSEHSRDTFDLFLGSARKVAREQLFPSYRALDLEPPELTPSGVKVHPQLKQLYPQLVELGILNATRPEEVGGQNLPALINAMASAYLMAGNLAVYAYAGLTTGAARLIESFGSDELKQEYMQRMYGGEWTGTMALTEPHAGSSLSDVQTRAEPTDAGHYLLRGSKVFISGGDHDVTENIVHLCLARIVDAPPGIKGVSLFVVPKRRRENGALVDNDAVAAGVFHKIGWKGLPSIALNLGENDACHGYLVGEPNQGIRYMFQMMNDARLMVGMNGAATASVAYLESLDYALNRPQGRAIGAKDPTAPQVPIIEHADVRRMLLRQKAIVEGSLSLLATASLYADLEEHAAGETERAEAHLLLDLLTPVAKTFPAEKGFESNALAVQIHGGYGYTSEYLPEAWLRDQKLNSLHEGTSGIQSLDLLGRKVVAGGGKAVQLLQREISNSAERAQRAGVPDEWIAKVQGSTQAMLAVTHHLAGLGLQGDVEGMLLHSSDYLDLFSTLVIGWQWLAQAAAAKEGLARIGSDQALAAFYRGKLAAAQYWIQSELPRIGYLAALCKSGEDSYRDIDPSWF
ncbi:MAG: acyl-CoA dehydrogenase [Polyangiaceae bacterium]